MTILVIGFYKTMSFDIKKIAHLARIAITEEEKQIVEPRLETIVQMFNDLQKIDTTGIEPMLTPLDGHYQYQRADVCEKVLDCETYQSLAPQVAAHLYIVPQVIE